jgi:hypothetical protein
MMHGPLLPKGTPPEEEPTEELEVLDRTELPVDGHHAAAPSTVTAGNLFRHPDTHPVILDLTLLKKYGPEWLGWEPETVEALVPDDFHTSISDVNLSKIQACKALHLVDDFWTRWEVFGWCTMALNGIFPDFKVLQVPSVAQCMIAVDIARQIRDDVEWSTEVKAYLSSVHLHDGLLVPQPPLEFVHVDASAYPVDVEEVRKKWPDMSVGLHAPKGESVEAEQLRRMQQVHQALEESRVSFRSQLPLVSHVPHR